MRKTIFYIFLLLLIACEKQVDWNIQKSDKTFVVVDGTITNEKKAHEIRLSKTVNELNALPEMISGATIILSNADSTWMLTEQIDNKGVYNTKNNFFAKPNFVYNLLISIDGNVYSAKSQLKPISPMTRLRYARNIYYPNLFNITWIANAYNANHPAMYEILLDWSDVAGYKYLDPALCKARLFYYSLPTIDVSQIFAPEMERILFPAGTKIIERKYSLNDDHAEFIRAMISETTWKGGYFDSAPANVPTNLSEGALGFFAVTQVIVDSLIVQ